MENESVKAIKLAAQPKATGEFVKYKGKSEAEYIGCITEWYIQKQPENSQESAQRYIEDLFKKVKDYNERKILLLVAKMSPRVVKIAEALKIKNFTIQILFFRKRAFDKRYSEHIATIADSFHICECAEELMYEVALSKAKVIHCFSGMDADIAAVLIQQKELFPKIVHDKYDIVCEMYPDIRRRELYETDRFCLEHAEALCCRGYEQEFLMKDAGYKISGDILQFFDYCNDANIEQRPPKKEILSVCYAGALSTEREQPGSPLACILEFSELCERNKCFFHVYPNEWDEIAYADYINLEKKNKYFRFHKPVAFEKLRKELSQYDYEVVPIKSSFRQLEANPYLSKNKCIYAATNKLFDAVDAGMPVIAATPVKLAGYLEEKGVLINWCIEDFDFEQLRIMKKRGDIYRRVAAVRKELAVSNHIDELIHFYDTLT